MPFFILIKQTVRSYSPCYAIVSKAFLALLFVITQLPEILYSQKKEAPLLREGLWDSTLSEENVTLGIPIGMESGLTHTYCINNKSQTNLLFQPAHGSYCRVISAEELDPSSYIVNGKCSKGNKDEDIKVKIRFKSEYQVTTYFLSNTPTQDVLVIRDLTHIGECPNGMHPGQSKVISVEQINSKNTNK